MSPVVKWVGSPEFHPQTAVAKTFATLHWMVGTLASTDRAFNSGRAASSTYGVGESEIHQYVQEKDYPFSDGNTYANQHTISIEHEGGWLLADGSRKNPSPAVQENSAQLLADISRRHGWGKLVAGVNVFGHNHWVATACPGTLNIAGIIARANELLGNPGAPLSGVNAGTASSSYGEATTVSNYQGLLNAAGCTPALDVDNNKGPKTVAALDWFQRKYGLDPDHVVGPLTLAKLHEVTGGTPAAAKLVVDGVWGAQTTMAEQRALGVKDDGKRGPNTIGAEQARTGAHVDRTDGPDTRKHLQLRLQALGYYHGRIDEVIGTGSIKALQQALNDGKF